MIYDFSLSVISSSMPADVHRDTNKYFRGTCCLLVTEYRETRAHFHYPSLDPSYVRSTTAVVFDSVILLPKETFSGLQDTQLETTINLLCGFSPSLCYTKANL